MYFKTAAPLLSAVLVSVLSCAAAQAPENSTTASSEAAQPVAQQLPAPVNLKVLPKDLTGKQVNDVMERWGVDLGVRCSACHGEDLDNVVSVERRRSRFAADSQPMKEIARLMYTMTEEINSNFIAKVEGSGLPVTCGTCHRGHVSPEPAVVAPVVRASANQTQHP